MYTTPRQGCDREAPVLEEPLHGLAQNIRDGLIVVEDDLLRWSNASFGALVGRVGACLEGLPVSEVLQGLPGALGPEAAAEFEAQVLHTDGRPRAVRCRRAGSSGEFAGVAWLIEDLDVPRALEAELLQRTREVASGNREIARLRYENDAERGVWKELRATLAHEMRTPLMVVGGYIRLLLSKEPGPLTAQQRRFLDESRRGCQRLGDFLDKLVEPSEVGTGGAVVKKVQGELSRVVEDVAAMFHPMLLERQLTLEVEVGQTPPVCFDALCIEQVLANLLANAVKHAPSGSRIRIRVRTLAACADGQSFAEVAVEDEGPGIDDGDEERVFEPYVQLHNGTSVEGLGLGLSICRRLVEAHGGRIRLDRAQNRGARFTFTLPLSEGGKRASRGEV